MKKEIVLVGALLFFFSTAHATVWYVHPDSALNSIQAGLDSCADDDTVCVGPGIYDETIDWPRIQGIHLVSELGPDMTIIDGKNSGSVMAITTGVDSITIIRGFTIRNGLTNGPGGGIYCLNSSPTIIDNIITGNTHSGIACEYVDRVLITNNTINANTGYGICCYDAKQVTITNNTITENTRSGIYCLGGECTITRNTITGNNDCGIVGTCCDLSVADNIINDNTGGGICFHSMSNYLSITDNTITGNTATCGGGILTSTFEGLSVTIANNTITDNTATQLGGGICIEGDDYTKAIITNNVISSNKSTEWGGGILIVGNYYYTSATITQNIITDNTSEYGGGICFFGFHYMNFVTITDNNIEENIATHGGGIYFNSCDYYNAAFIINNTIIDNIASYGGGIDISGFSLEEEWPQIIRGNTISGNTAGYGAGVLCRDKSKPSINYCTIADNNGDGIYSESGSNPVIHYNNITDNTGDGVCNVDPNVLVDGCYNWWGHTSGPGGVGPGTGDEVSDWVDYADWFARPVIQEDIADFKPNTFNKKRHGKWVTVYVELRDGYNPEDIDISGVRLKGNLPGIVPAELKPTHVGDYDKDGVPDKMIKFNSDLVSEVLGIGDSVEVTIECKVGGDDFQIVDYIRVIEPGGTQNAESAGVPEFKLASIYPNPFVGSTAIRFDISYDTYVTLKILDTSGRLVKVLVNRKVDAGTYTTAWNCTDNFGEKLPSGVYFLKFAVSPTGTTDSRGKGGEYKETKKLILLR